MGHFNRVKALVVRFFLCLHFALVVWRVTVSWGDRFWLLTAAILPFLGEAVYTVVARKGMEWKLFSVCFFFYLCATLPGIWLLEIQKTITYQNGNFTQVEDISVGGVEIPVRLSPNTWVLVTEEMMLYLLILGRWLLPRGGVGREQLTQLLFGFVGIASDIMELFSLFDEDAGVRHNTLLTYIILGVWSLSVLQFTLTFVTAHRPRRARGLRLSTSDDDPDRAHRVSVLRVELLATVLSMIMQDGPFLAVRLYTIITFNVITYSLVFFTAKNVLVLMLLFYKIFLLMVKLCCPKSYHDGDDDEEEEDDDIVAKKKIDDRHRDIKPADIIKWMDKKGRFDPRTVELMKMRINQQREPDPRDMVKMPPLTHINGRVMVAGDSLSGDFRHRRPDNTVNNPLYSGYDVTYIGDLQKAVEGPATPAKKMERAKKYDSYGVQDETGNDNTKKSGKADSKSNISIISSNDLAADSTADSQLAEHVDISLNPAEQPSQPDQSPDDKLEELEDSDHGFPASLELPESPDVLGSSGRVPTNGALNALAVGTMEWGQNDEEIFY